MSDPLAADVLNTSVADNPVDPTADLELILPKIITVPAPILESVISYIPRHEPLPQLCVIIKFNYNRSIDEFFQLPVLMVDLLQKQISSQHAVEVSENVIYWKMEPTSVECTLIISLGWLLSLFVIDEEVSIRPIEIELDTSNVDEASGSKIRIAEFDLHNNWSILLSIYYCLTRDFYLSIHNNLVFQNVVTVFKDQVGLQSLYNQDYKLKQIKRATSSNILIPPFRYNAYNNPANSHLHLVPIFGKTSDGQICYIRSPQGYLYCSIRDGLNFEVILIQETNTLIKNGKFIDTSNDDHLKSVDLVFTCFHEYIIILADEILETGLRKIDELNANQPPEDDLLIIPNLKLESYIYWSDNYSSVERDYNNIVNIQHIYRQKILSLMVPNYKQLLNSTSLVTKCIIDQKQFQNCYSRWLQSRYEDICSLKTGRVLKQEDKQEDLIIPIVFEIHVEGKSLISSFSSPLDNTINRTSEYITHLDVPIVTIPIYYNNRRSKSAHSSLTLCFCEGQVSDLYLLHFIKKVGSDIQVVVRIRNERHSFSVSCNLSSASIINSDNKYDWFNVYEELSVILNPIVVSNLLSKLQGSNTDTSIDSTFLHTFLLMNQEDCPAVRNCIRTTYNWDEQVLFSENWFVSASLLAFYNKINNLNSFDINNNTFIDKTNTIDTTSGAVHTIYLELKMRSLAKSITLHDLIKKCFDMHIKEGFSTKSNY